MTAKISDKPEVNVEAPLWFWEQNLIAHTQREKDMAYPAVTVITTTYNCASTLEATMRSVIFQDYPNLNYWVIDGKSKDDTCELIRKYEDQLTGWVSEADKGIYDAMNKGLAKVEQGWVYFLGGDDQLASPDALRKLMEHAKPEIDVLYGDVLRVPSGVRYDGAFDRQKLALRNICHQAICYRVEALRALDGYNLRYPLLADYAHNIRSFFQSDIEWQYAPVLVARYQEGGATGGHRLDEAFWADREQLFKEFFASEVPANVLYRAYGPYILLLMKKARPERPFATSGSAYGMLIGGTSSVLRLVPGYDRFYLLNHSTSHGCIPLS